jgi:bifunctional non-homologous end joining protein LigD
VFDLDPDVSIPFKRVCDAAFQINDLLNSVDLQGFVKTSGGKGLHILVPIRRRATWSNVAKFTEAISHRLASDHPRSFTTSPSKSQRRGKIYIDTLRNRFGATSIAAYSTRSRNGAPVSMPISWDELPTLISANGFTTNNAAARLLQSPEDPWREYYKTEQSLTKSMISQFT